MKREIEARLLDVDVDDFIAKLKKNRADFMGDWLQVRKCFDFNPVRKNSWIRLRTNGTKTTLTIKEIVDKSINGTKESEVEVSSFEETEEILNKLGYFARSTQENRRIRFYLNKVEIDIDFWPKIPTYVEFEAETEEEIKAACKKLDIDYNSLVTLDVSSIYHHYGYNIEKLGDTVLLEDDRKPIKN